MKTSHQTIAAIHKALKPLVDDLKIMRAYTYTQRITGKRYSEGYSLRINKNGHEVVVEYHAPPGGNDSQRAARAEALRLVASTLTTAGFEFRVSHFNKPNDKEVVSSGDWIHIPYEEAA